MDSHEWHDETADGKRFYRGNFHPGRGWSVLTTTMKRNPVWEKLEQPSAEVWAELRDIVWKKYQRKRCPWDRVAELDAILSGEADDRSR